VHVEELQRILIDTVGGLAKVLGELGAEALHDGFVAHGAGAAGGSIAVDQGRRDDVGGKVNHFKAGQVVLEVGFREPHGQAELLAHPRMRDLGFDTAQDAHESGGVVGCLDRPQRSALLKAFIEPGVLQREALEPFGRQRPGAQVGEESARHQGFGGGVNEIFE